LAKFIIDYPFFRLDKTIAFDLPEKSAEFANELFENIFDEYHSDNKDKFQFIQSYTQLLLLITKRHFLQIEIDDENSRENRTADVLLISRFQSLLEVAFTDEYADSEIRHPAFYAEKIERSSEPSQRSCKEDYRQYGNSAHSKSDFNSR
jgi:hypothetical protein